MQVYDDRFQAESGWNWIITASGCLFKKNCITTHRNMHVELLVFGGCHFLFLSLPATHIISQDNTLIGLASYASELEFAE